MTTTSSFVSTPPTLAPPVSCWVRSLVELTATSWVGSKVDSCAAGRVSCVLRSQPRREDDPADVLVGVLARAVEDARPDPQDRPPEMVRVALDLRVEEVERGALCLQQLVGVVEVLPGLRDGPRSVVVELPVLVAADDVPRPEGLDAVDRLAPRAEASDDRGLHEVHVNAVVDHVAGDDEIEIRDVQDGGVIAVGRAHLDDHQLVILER